MGVGEKVEDKKEFESTFKNGMYSFKGRSKYVGIVRRVRRVRLSLGCFPGSWHNKYHTRQCKRFEKIPK